MGSKDIIHTAASEAVERAITHTAHRRGAEHPSRGHSVSAKKLATDVKHALDENDDSGKHAEAQERDAKAAAKQAIMKEVHRAASSASNEAAAKGKTKKDQTDAANKAASDVMKKGRKVQKVVKRITEKKATEKKAREGKKARERSRRKPRSMPEVSVHVAPINAEP